MVDRKMCFEPASVEDAVREQGDLSAYTVSNATAADVLKCSADQARVALKGKGRKIGKKLHYRQADVEGSLSPSRLSHARGDRRGRRAVWPHAAAGSVCCAWVDRNPELFLQTCLSARLPAGKRLGAHRPVKWTFGPQWHKGAVEGWFEVFVENPEDLLTEGSFRRFLDLQERHDKNYVYMDAYEREAKFTQSGRL